MGKVAGIGDAAVGAQQAGQGRTTSDGQRATKADGASANGKAITTSDGSDAVQVDATSGGAETTGAGLAKVAAGLAVARNTAQGAAIDDQAVDGVTGGSTRNGPTQRQCSYARQGAGGADVKSARLQAEAAGGIADGSSGGAGGVDIGGASFG